MKPAARLGNSSHGHRVARLLQVIAVATARFCVSLWADEGELGLFDTIESFRADSAIPAVGERTSSQELVRGLTLKSSTGRVYRRAILQNTARRIRINSTEDAMAAISYLGDPDPKMRYLVLFSIFLETGLGDEVEQRVEAEYAIIWGSDVKTRLEWMQRITKALAAHLKAKS